MSGSLSARTCIHMISRSSAGEGHQAGTAGTLHLSLAFACDDHCWISELSIESVRRISYVEGPVASPKRRDTRTRDA